MVVIVGTIACSFVGVIVGATIGILVSSLAG